MSLEKDWILKFCSLRRYAEPVELSASEFSTVSEDGRAVLIRIVDVLDQACLSALPADTLILFFCNKQKKFRYSLEELGIEVHLLKDLRVQLIQHRFFTPMERLGGAELEPMEKHKPHLPLLLKSDPMRKIYGFNVGDVVKIYRQDGSIFFRVVTNQ